MIALITRCKNEPFVHEFVSYYINEGIDRIFLYDDKSNAGTYDKIDEKIINKIEFVTSDVFSDEGSLKLLFEKAKEYDWIVNVDIDEFISSKDDKTIKEHLESTYKHVDCIKIPWVIMSHNKRERNPESILREITHRWNHDKKHSYPNNDKQPVKFRCRYDHIEVKSIFKPHVFTSCYSHMPRHPRKDVVIVESIENKPSGIDPYFQNLRETSIEKATLLCYHYRIVSEEHAQTKQGGNFYKQFEIEEILNFDFPELEDLSMKKKAELKI